MSHFPIYEKNLSSCSHIYDRIVLVEYNFTPYDNDYIYSGLTHTLSYANFTTYFTTPFHEYSNIILNNDVYIFTGITNEVHYFVIDDFQDGTPITIDPLLSGYTESEIIDGFYPYVISDIDILISPLTGCSSTQIVKSNLPWVVITTEGDDCEEFIPRRPNRGWTLDLVFNKNELTEWKDMVFHYTGVRDEYDPMNYADNNLSFSFTDEGKIEWKSYRYTGYCDENLEYVEDFFITSGITKNSLCDDGTSNDFNITIVFDRFYEYVDCDIENEGGWNDLVNTGTTSTTGSTIIVDEQIEVLNPKWLSERHKRLGRLKIYHNGKPMEVKTGISYPPNLVVKPQYHFDKWEEVVLSDRGYQPFTHIIGGGVTGCGGIHEGVCEYTIKYAAYYDIPMNFIEVNEKYLTTTKENFNIVECQSPCQDNISST